MRIGLTQALSYHTPRNHPARFLSAATSRPQAEAVPSRTNYPHLPRFNVPQAFTFSHSRLNAFFAGKTKNRANELEETETPLGESIEESFFLRPHYERNPFAEKADELENNPLFRRQARAYENRLEHSAGAKITKIAVNSTLGYSLLQLINVTHSPVLGIVAGCTTGLYTEPVSRGIVKLWEKPPELVSQKEALDQLDREIRTGKLVKTIGKDWPQLGQHKEGEPFQTVANFFSRKSQSGSMDEPATLLGTALISRYPEHQDALKSALPEIRGKYQTRSKILPALERAITTSEYQSCQATPGPALEKGIQNMLQYGELERQYLDTPFRRNEENRRYEAHLLKKLPDIVEYLEQD
jgi:hypothetical protein